MLKKLALAALIASGIHLLDSPKAEAKPGQTLNEAQNWVKHQPFLKSSLIADTSFPGSYFLSQDLDDGNSLLFAVWLEKNRVYSEEIRTRA